MGAYLSSPSLTKETSSGTCPNPTNKSSIVTWSATSMQGWRKTMEDAHITTTSCPSTSGTNDTMVFSVFDGHGGSEVALFCEKHFVEELVKRKEWKEGDVGKSLVETFHKLDEMVDSSEYREELSRLTNGNKNKPQGGAGEEGDGEERISTANAIDLFQKLLTMSKDKEGKEDDDKTSKDKAEAPSTSLPSETSSFSPAPPSVGRQRVLSTSVSGINPRTGRQECLLPDHPVHAGCTSVVVVVNGTTITVANAGDSRAVMMRKNDKVFPLSYDHKPSDEIESTRINGAGGFVNQFGRVNGNLNLSRSIGDLKYKQNVEVAREQQMITAEPDLITVEMLPDDEFIVVGCDGIWDCLTNEECCQFVKTRIDEMTPAKIIEECLDTIVSEDPRATQGIGGDNMSLLLIDLRSETREVNKKKD